MSTRIGLIFDRSAELMLRNWVAIVLTVAPGIAIASLLYSFPYVPLSAYTSPDTMMMTLWSSTAAKAFGGLCIWFCSAAVVVGVRWISLGYPSRPFSWLQFALARLPAIAATFVLPVLVSTGTMALFVAIVVRGDDSFVAYLELEPYLPTLVFLVLLVTEFVLLVMAAVLVASLIDDIGLMKAVREVIASASGREKRRPFFTLIGALYLITAVTWEAETYAVPRLSLLHAPAWIVIVIDSAFENAVGVFVMIVLAASWLTGFIGPRASTQDRLVQKTAQ